MTTKVYLNPADHNVKTGNFISDGLSLAFTLRTPKTQHAKKLPAILMMHGWGGTQNSWVPPFVERFLELGFAVMTFDYRSWGKSQGLPRHVIKIKDRLADAEAALATLKRQPEIDTKKIVLWGTSLGGGHACSLAKKHPDLFGVIAQVPMLDGRASAKVTPRLQKLRLGIHALADLFPLKRKPVYIPIYADPEAFGSMTRDNAATLKKASEKLYGKGADNIIAARSLLTMASYKPLDSLAGIKVPALIIGGKKDTVAPFPTAAVKLIGNPNIKVIELDANHFEPYMQPSFAQNIAHQVDFLNDLLAKALA